MSAVAINQNERSPPPSTHQGNLAHGRHDLSAVFGELLNSAQLTAATASIANTMATQPGLLSDRLLSNYLPPAPKIFPETHLRLIELDPTTVIPAAVRAYYDELAAQRVLIEHCYQRWPTHSTDGAKAVAATAESWRGLATLALAAIHEMSCWLPTSEWRPGLDRVELVNYMLRRAAAGDAPCIDARGAVEIPPWADRRRDTRELRGLQAVLQVDDSLQRVAVLDASEVGIGVLGLTNAAVGSRVGLLIKPGSNLSGTVVWVNGARAGIKLDSRLPANSQLLEHLS